MNRKARAEQTARLIEEAERHVGYRAQPNRMSAFQLPKYGGEAWNGTFIDRILHDAMGDFAEVRFISTVAALGYFVKRNGVYQKPRPGDIVFFNFATDPLHPFEQPHVGLVTRVNRDGSFETIEGETAPQAKQGSQLVDGVFNRMRYSTDALGFVRPVPLRRGRPDDKTVTVKESYLNSNPKTTARAVEIIQTALNVARPKWKFNRGKKDGVFRSAFGTFSRESGFVKNRGELDNRELVTLADTTGTFELE